MKYYLTSFFSGYSFRSKVEHDPDGDLAVIQMKDLNHDFQEISDDLTRISSEGIKEKYLLEKGDVIFIAKGANNYAYVFDKPIKAVAASAFFVLRPDPAAVIPEYLAWYLNQETAQRYIEENRAGTYIPNVNKAVLLNLDIKLPELTRQKLVAKIDELRMKEHKLILDILERKDIVINKILNDII